MIQTVAYDLAQDFEMPVRLKMLPAVAMTEEQFFDFCQQNQEIRIERTAQGELIIMAPAGGESSAQSLSVAAQLYIWSKKDGTGMAFDSSAGFTLPSGAVRSPDASWVSNERLASVTPEQMKKFLPLCPDFAVEILSPSDSLRQTEEKVKEFLVGGTRLGWLINPRNRQVSVYRPGEEVRVLEDPATLSGDPELPGFVLDLGSVW